MGSQLLLLRTFGHKLANDCLSQTEGGSVNCSLPLWYLKQCQWMSLNQKQGSAVRKMPPWVKHQFAPPLLFSVCLQVHVRTPGFVYLSLRIEKITWTVDHFGSMVSPPKCSLWVISISILYKSRSSRGCFWKQLTLDLTLPQVVGDLFSYLSLERARCCFIPVCMGALWVVYFPWVCVRFGILEWWFGDCRPEAEVDLQCMERLDRTGVLLLTTPKTQTWGWRCHFQPNSGIQSLALNS